MLWKDDRISATPGYFSLRFKFHVDSDSVSDSSLNSVGLRKSFNHRRKGHSSTLLCASFCLVFIAIWQRICAGKIAKDCYIIRTEIVIMKFESETIKSGGLISYRSSKERFQAPFSARNICLILKYFKLDHNLQSTGEDSLRRQTKLRLYHNE